MVYAEQATALTGFKEEIQKAKSEIQAEMGERIRESRTEIEQDLIMITPLKNKMVIVDEKVDGMDKKMDALGAGMKLLLGRNETAAAPVAAPTVRQQVMRDQGCQLDSCHSIGRGRQTTVS